MKEHIYVVVTGQGIDKEKFLGSKVIDNGTGRKVAEAMVDILGKWHIIHKVVAFSYDTCSVNTGKNLGKLV